jgi:TonB family protein
MGICQALILLSSSRASPYLPCWIFSLTRARVAGLRRCALLFTLLFALALSPLPYQSAQAPDFPKSEAPTPQSTLHAKVSRVKIGGNVAKSLLKHKVQPRYPKEARDNRIQGTVRLHVVLSTAGKVQQLELVSGDPVLAKAALDAVRQWEYKPTLLNGEPVEVDTTVDVVFSLVQ